MTRATKNDSRYDPLGRPTPPVERVTHTAATPAAVPKVSEALRSIGVCLLTVALASCGTGSTGAGGPRAQPPTTDLDANTPSPSAALAGGPPIWPLTSELMDRIIGGVASRYFPNFARDYAPVAERCAAIRRGPMEGDLITGNSEVVTCLRPYLEELGVGREALRLFFDSGVAIWRAEPTGPFWLAEGFDYDMYGSNGSPPEYLFTPDGEFDIPGQFTSFYPPEGWAPLLDAIEVAHAAPPMPEIRDAYAEIFGMKPADIAFQAYGEQIDLHPAVETSSGWTIPFSWLLIGCHACDTPIVGRFELIADAEGSIADVRFVDLCYDPTYEPNDPGDSPAGGRFGLADCGS